MLGREKPHDRPPYNVLFLCTGNSARSIIAEALVNQMGKGRFRGFSAGSFPKGEVHPIALNVLETADLPTAGLRSKSWDEFAAPGAPEMDFIFTVCDNAANETCPIWPGHPMTAHWGVADPAAAEGSDAERQVAFLDTVRMLRNRISLFLALPIAEIDSLALHSRLARSAGPTTPLQPPTNEIRSHRVCWPPKRSARFLLVATVVGSGIMAERLAGGNDAVALLGNTLATGAILYVLITALGPISGAHFNPAVSAVFALRREIAPATALAYTAAQIAGGIVGTLLAHAMFAEPLIHSPPTPEPAAPNGCPKPSPPSRSSSPS